MSTARPDKPGWLAEIKRRRLFRAMAAYFVITWLLLQIANVTFPPHGLPEEWQRVPIFALIVFAIQIDRR